MTQADLDALIGRLNAAHPDTQANREVLTSGLAAAPSDVRTFMTCGLEWLTKTPQEMYELTGVPNHWYPPQTERPSPAP